MGTDKAFVPVGGRWLVTHALSALEGASQRLIIGGCNPRLPEVAAKTNAIQVSDRWPGEGPLGAVITALAHARHPVTVILPCDLPDISAADVALLVDTVNRDRSNPPLKPQPVAAVFTDQRRHHLPLAITTRAAAVAEQLFESGLRSVAALLDGITVIDLPAPPTAVTDIDTPADLDRFRGMNEAVLKSPRPYR